MVRALVNVTVSRGVLGHAPIEGARTLRGKRVPMGLGPGWGVRAYGWRHAGIEEARSHGAGARVGERAAMSEGTSASRKHVPVGLRPGWGCTPPRQKRAAQGRWAGRERLLVRPGCMGSGREREGSMRGCGANRKGRYRAGVDVGVRGVYASALRALCVVTLVAPSDGRSPGWGTGTAPLVWGSHRAQCTQSDPRDEGRIPFGCLAHLCTNCR